MTTTRESYRELFNNVLELIHQAQMMSLFSYEVFDSFPNKIGNDLKQDFEAEITYSLKERDLFIEGKNHAQIIEILGERSASVLNGASYSYPFKEIQKISSQNGDMQRNIAEIGDYQLLIGNIDFETLISEKQLVYIIGLIEGFILDSVRVLYFHKEELIEAHAVQPPFADLRQLPNFPDLKIERIIDITEIKWSKGSFSDRFSKLKTKFNIILDFDPKLEAIFDEANLLRNCILHNGAKVSKSYFREIGLAKGLNIGDPIKITRYFNEALYYLSIDLIKKLFFTVDSYSFQGHSDPASVDEFHPGYFKDAMLLPDNWIFQRLTQQGIF